MLVVGTAGHIDHGKSALVRALTGVDPDRLREEQVRGMTIDLGFAPLQLPSGRLASIVDVPGHERFIANMLAGASGVDVALLVVAADEGVMPQTREHLAILDLLGIERAVVALTKADLVEDDWIELVTNEVSELLLGTSLAGSPLVPVSAATGSGLSNLLTILDAVFDTAPGHADAGTPRLPIDRVFTVAGFGTVVTGTLSGGSLTVGQETEILPRRLRARIRAIQSHGNAVNTAHAGQRTALNLAGVEKDHVARGDVVTLPGTMRPVRRIDAHVRVLAESPVGLKTNDLVSVYAGAAQAMARVFPLSPVELPQGEAGWVQLRLTRPSVMWRGQRVVIRLPSPSVTIGGGPVVDIAPRRRARESAPQRLEALASTELERSLPVLLHESVRDISWIASMSGVSRAAAEAALHTLSAKGEVEIIADGYATAEAVERLRRIVVKGVESYHKAYPLRRAMPREEVRRVARLDSRSFTDLMAPLVTEGVLTEVGAGFCLPEHAEAVSDAGVINGSSPAATGARAVLDALSAAPFAPPTIDELTRSARVDREVLRFLSEGGQIIRVSESVYLTRAAYVEMVDRITAVIRSEGSITVARIRDTFDTSRKYALAFAEHLDSRRITRRVGDERVLNPAFRSSTPGVVGTGSEP